MGETRKIRKDESATTYCANSTLIFASFKRETAVNAAVDKRKLAGQGSVHWSTTSTLMMLSLHGLLGPLRHLSMYLLEIIS